MTNLVSVKSKQSTKMFNQNFNSIIELLTVFDTEEKCIAHLEELYWEGEPVSPFDSTSKVWKCKNGKYKCANSGKYFNVRAGTIFDNSKISLRSWFLGIWLVTCHKKGISSCQLAKDLKIGQKAAWFMLQRIRKCYCIENYNELSGTVESDETFYGGKNKNRHNDKKFKNSAGRSWADKVPILGMIERGGKMTAIVIPNTSGETLQPLVRKYVKPNSTFIADDWQGYNGLSNGYDHRIVKDISKGYRNDYDPSTHTNTIEGAWKIFKNSARDNYCHVSKKHIQLYVDEFVYRFNTRKETENYKFNWLLLNGAVRTKYKDLTRND